jgi:hypothetical protein
MITIKNTINYKMSTRKAQLKHRSTERLLNDTIGKTEDIVKIGDASMDELHKQRKQFEDMDRDMDDVEDKVDEAGGLMRGIRNNMLAEHHAGIAVIILLAMALGMLLYFRVRYALLS